MNIKRSTLAAAITAVLAAGVSGQAAAEVYAGSRLLTQNFLINITPAAAAEINDFSFNTEAHATLTGNPNADDADSCSTAGTPCAGPAPVLQSIATLGAPVRGPGDFTFFGPVAVTTYANSAAEIGEAQLVTGNPTTTSQISEVEIQGSGAGTGTTSVSSQTTFTFDFSLVGGPGTLSLDFDADPNLFVEVDTLGLISALAQASTSATFELSGNNGVSVQWTPNGSLSGLALEFDDCTGATCVEDADDEDLTVTRSLPPGNPSSNGFSDVRTGGADPGFQDFGITLSLLPAGAYTISLTVTTFARAEQAVPEPGMLALLGIGLAGLGVARRRSRI